MTSGLRLPSRELSVNAGKKTPAAPVVQASACKQNIKEKHSEAVEGTGSTGSECRSRKDKFVFWLTHTPRCILKPHHPQWGLEGETFISTSHLILQECNSITWNRRKPRLVLTQLQMWTWYSWFPHEHWGFVWEGIKEAAETENHWYISLQYITYSSFKIGVVLSRAYTPAEAQQSPRIRILNHT